MFRLRDYQECNLESIRDQFADDARRVLHQAPTGSGKGVLLAHIAACAVARAIASSFLGTVKKS